MKEKSSHGRRKKGQGLCDDWREREREKKNGVREGNEAGDLGIVLECL